MVLFILGCVLLIAATVVAVFGRGQAPKAVVISASAGLAVLGVISAVWSTAIYIEDNEGGIIVRKFGGPLKPGQIIATNGESGPQAGVLSPGWKFWYLPWIYELIPTPNITIEEGFVGIVKAEDGIPLPEGEVYAPAWESPSEMLDAQKFLSSGKGFKGPQLTVLPPGQYRYNPRFFKIVPMPQLDVEVGEVAVIKANAGPIYEPKEGEVLEEVNGTPIVPNGFRGIWKTALTPNAYYMHPKAYKVTTVSTAIRIYEYTGPSDRPDSKTSTDADNSIEVKSKDGFEFPVDVRVSVKITAKDAPYVVGMLKNPDAESKKPGYDVLERRVILPALRAIFRNSAETRGALEYVNSRSEIEKSATTLFQEELKKFRVESDGVFVADIGLSETEEGKKLLTTQTEREIANQEVDTFKQKQLSEAARAESERARAEAEQEQPKAEARAKVEIAKSEAEAAIAKAEGEAEAFTKKINALKTEGAEIFVKLEELKIVAEAWEKGGSQIPEILVNGGGANNGDGSMQALILKLLKPEGKEVTIDKDGKVVPTVRPFPKKK